MIFFTFAGPKWYILGWWQEIYYSSVKNCQKSQIWLMSCVSGYLISILKNLLKSANERYVTSHA